MLRNRTFFVLLIAFCVWCVYTKGSDFLSSFDTELALDEIHVVPSVGSLPTTKYTFSKSESDDRVLVPMKDENAFVAGVSYSAGGSQIARTALSGGSYGGGLAYAGASAARLHSYGGGSSMSASGGRSGGRSGGGISGGGVAGGISVPMVKRTRKVAAPKSPAHSASVSPTTSAAPLAAAGIRTSIHQGASGGAAQVKGSQDFSGQAYSGLSLGYASAAQYMGGVMRKLNAGPDAMWNGWLINGTGKDALSYTGDGTYYYDMDELRRLFEEAQQNNGHMKDFTWEDFLAWFNHSEQQRHFAPMGDAVFMMFLLALGYAIMIRKRRIQSISTEKERICL